MPKFRKSQGKDSAVVIEPKPEWVDISVMRGGAMMHDEGLCLHWGSLDWVIKTLTHIRERGRPVPESNEDTSKGAGDGA